MRHVVCLLVCLLASTAASEAATRTVCASGCQYTNLQTAINEAVPGDTILLRAGQKYVGNYILKAKGGSSTAFITITSDAPASSLPAAGVRLVPEGRPGANTARNALARLTGQGGSYRSAPVIETEPGAHHYRLQFLEIDGTDNVGYGPLVAIGDNDSSQTTAASVPYGIILDRMWIHGHATKGTKRGVAANGRSLDILNSYIDDVFATADAQAIASFNAPGPIRIINNFLEGTGENVMFGGDDPKIPGLIPSDIEIRGNHFYKDPAWRNPVLKTPAAPSVSPRTGGALAAGTHYFKVVAVMSTGGTTIVSAPSAERSVTVGGGGAVAISWSSTSGADKYRVYRGTSSNSQSKYLEVSGTSMTYTGSSEVSSAPRTSGTKWTSKNLLELKNAQRVIVDGNLFEHNWSGFQNGYAILFTPKNQGLSAPQTVVRDIVFSNNIVRHVAMGINIAGRDWETPTQQARNIKIVNNVFEDISAAYGNKGAFLLIAGGPADIVVDHNTIFHEGAVLEVEGPVVPGFVYTNNLSRHNQYGVKGNKRAAGTDSLNAYFSNWVFRGNVLAGGPASSYPAGNYFPTLAQFSASFVDADDGDYSLVAASPFLDQATDGSDVGVNMTALRRAQSTQVTGEMPVPLGPDPTPDPTPEPQPTALPEGWLSEDVGAVGATGSASASGGTFVVKGAGADIWGTADAFHFAYRPLSGDGTIVARVASLAGSEAWTKVGVMIRARTDAGSAHAFMLVSKGKGLAFQRRKSNGASSVNTSGGSGSTPRWVKLTRAGNVITAYSSTNGTSWTRVGSDTFSMPADVLIGLASGSHHVSSLATATFDNVSISSGQAVLPQGWESNDIGSVGRSGSASHDGGTFTVNGAGGDIWGTADALHLAWRTLEGDGAIVARVASISGSEAWTKVGVMMRQSLDAGSAQALMLVSVSKGVNFQRRTVTGGSSVSTNGGSATAPEWVRLVRTGQTITASVSADGHTWRAVGSDTFSMVGAIHVGLAISSHTRSALAAGTFDNVVVTER